MKVLLMDLDLLRQNRRRRRIFPNLALMKLSAHHKARGDEVYLNFPLQRPDITYASCVFTWNSQGKASVPDGAIAGGSGLDLKAELPPEVEHIKPDYDLYPGANFSMGFTSRGCTRKCPWCIVPEKEGHIRTSASVYEFLDRRFRSVVLLDNNFLASPDWRHTVADLINIGLEVDFNQGLDIRLVDDEVSWCLAQLRTRKLRFAFDDITYERAVREGIKALVAQGLPSRRLSFYVLYGFQDDDTAVERLKILQSYNVDIYPMGYRGADGKEPGRKLLYHGDELWHGPRRNINKFLRLVGRLTE